MRIIELQRRLREVGRIRIGVQVPTSNGRSRPSKLTTFRLTSRDRQVIDAAAGQWGGQVEPWPDAPGGAQWQVTTDTAEMQVIVPPGDMAFSQAYEQWTAGGCKVRCDGQWDHLADKACHCDPEQRACDIHTRLSVILPDLPGLGVWRLDTQGYYAAVELGGVVDICASYSARGAMLPARLRLEQREVKRPKPGGGGVETRKFAVPVLDIDVHPLALTGGVDGATGELVGARAALPAANLTPVPPVDGALAPSIAEQLAQVDQPVAEPGRRRANAAAPLPATGLKPRTAVEANAEAAAPRLDGSAVDEIRSALNELGVEARRAFLERFGCKPAELPLDRVDEAREFVASMAPFDPPPDGGVEPPAGDVAGEVGPDAHGSVVEVSEVVDRVTSSGPAATDSPVFTVQEVARLGAQVLRPFAGEGRGVTARVDRLRHAVTLAATKDKRSLTECDERELSRVRRRLVDIREGRLTVEVLPDGVALEYPSGGDGVTVLWSQVEPVEAAAS